MAYPMSKAQSEMAAAERRHVVRHDLPFPTPHHVEIYEGTRLIKMRRFNTARQAESFLESEKAAANVYRP
jgi:hypothetical protein